MDMFEVGGCVRDEILGVPSKDIDFTVVLSSEDVALSAVGPFETMQARLMQMGFKIFLSTPEFLTVRAQFPDADKLPEPWARNNGFTTRRNKLTADFVLARKESDYADGRRPDKVEPGTLEDDLARRDFTMNAIAKDTDGSYIDPFNGRADIDARIIRAVGDPAQKMGEDALRAVRALRFALTTGFRIEGELQKVLWFDTDLHDKVAFKISDDRIKDELSKMFRFDSLGAMWLLHQYPALTGAMFSGRVSLDATLKTKGRGR